MNAERGSTHRTEPTLNAKPLLQRMRFDNVREAPYVAPSQPPVRYLRWLLLLLAILLAVALYQESRNHFYQSAFWHWYAGKLTYSVKPGASTEITFPGEGPFDKRFGYSSLPQWGNNLQQQGFVLSAQSRFSSELQRYSRYGFYPPYQEKNQPGLTVLGCQQDTLYHARFPGYQFAATQQVAPAIVAALLFVEDRSLLTPVHPNANPVLNLPRLGAAVWSQLQRAAGIPAAAAGGSTLATQLEKYRHTSHGFTFDTRDKFHQLVSASVRTYAESTNTLASRQRIVLDYLNSVPLAATAGHGEVHGLGDGLQAWFGADPSVVNSLLWQGPPYTNQQALALRQVIALIIAQRRPSYYLVQGRRELEQLTSSYLALMQQQGILDKQLATLALQQQLQFNTQAVITNVTDYDFKASTMARSRLAALLQQSLYQLDRLDLTAHTTIDSKLQRAVSQHLQQLADYDTAAAAGLFAERLLKPGQQDQVRYSFTLYQSTVLGNKVRLQTDNSDLPFDFNDASKLELGSTAKLRVLVSYLEIIAELHRLYAAEPADSLQFLDIAPQDHLTAWAVQYLTDQPGSDLSAMLLAAVQRRYSANPKESFFTGGGLHTFSNFNKDEDKLNPTIAEALQLSINLPFVRLLQDMVNYSIYHGENSSYQLLKDDDNPQREQYLRRFADREGTTYLRRFWQKYQTKTAQQQLDIFIQSSRQTPDRLAAAYLYIHPDSTLPQFGDFMQEQFGSNNDWQNLYSKYQPDAFNLPDLAYLSRSHPLELWLLAYLQQQPEATLADAIAASAQQRQEIYQWLFKTRFRSARDNRIRTMLEIEAFWDLHQRWQRLGYPFEYLVPSLATALGSSGDRPAALAELVGIILNNGKQQPTMRVEGLDFAVDTPYESRFTRPQARAVQRIDTEVAKTVRQLLQQVVNDGTARRLQQGFSYTMAQGGKTGTGDNRLVQLNARGQQVSSKALNRTATYVFYLGAAHFGVLTAYVADDTADQFSFTSALPLQVLNSMAPILLPYIEHSSAGCN
ncbi:transglycosylase domain-containing protein [Rheinheimera gaetbuli]